MADPAALAESDVVQIHMLEGNPNGPRILEIANTNSRAVACPRISYQDFRDELDFAHPGVYVLVFDPSLEQGAADEKIYIGESDDLRKRLTDHSQGDGRQDWDWNWFVAFTSRDIALHKAHVKYLEARLIELAKGAKRADLTQSSPERPHLDRAQQAICERFLRQIRLYCPLLGIHAFDSAEVRSIPQKPAQGGAEIATTPSSSRSEREASPELFLDSPPDVHARGAITADGGFVVFKGSTIRKEATAVLTPPMLALRSRMLMSNVEFDSQGRPALKTDERFNSPSQAASVLLAYRVSGWDWWKNPAGMSLNDMERANNAVSATQPHRAMD
jgi:predicted GIY-YIG superfamily endonuclease